GKTDYDHVVVAYRGTEFGKGDGDLTADVQQIVLGLGERIKRVQIPYSTIQTYETLPAQTTTALQFAKNVQKTYKNATIDVTGHSLGGGLASYVACMNDWCGTVFSAPNIYRLLDKDGKEKVNSG